MIKVKQILLATIAGLSLGLLSESLPAQAKPMRTQAEPMDLKIAQAKSPKANDFYKQAEKQLPEDYYVLYRVVERLARANGLDISPWRVYISPKYDINAFATQVNLLAFYSGLLDMVHGDNDAIACVAGHEMAHHVQNHIALGEAERQKILQQKRTEAVQEVAAEEQDLRDSLLAMDVGSWVTGQASSLGSLIQGSRGIPGFVGAIVGSVLQGQRQRRLENAVKRIEQIAAEKEVKIRKEWSELGHRQEFEADKLGYQYAVRAGFKPEGCLAVMNVLNRLPGSQTSGETHPTPSDRMNALKALASQYPTATLVAEGRKNLTTSSKPLTYDLSRDQISLRISSKSGTSKGGFPE
jgi:predicted Zn-dependent protease